jgi:hypothetical protein
MLGFSSDLATLEALDEHEAQVTPASDHPKLFSIDFIIIRNF